MKVAVFGRFYNERTTSSVETLFTYLLQKDIDVYIETQFFNIIKEGSAETESLASFKTFDTLDKSFDFLVSVGGDGTILRELPLLRISIFPL